MLETCEAEEHPVDSGDELMDSDGLGFAETERALADLRRANRWLLGHGPVLRTLLPRLAANALVLDLGTGSGDVASALARAARQKGRPIRLVALDSKLRHLTIGRRWFPDQMRVVAAAHALPFVDTAVDWAFSSLFFHHFGEVENRSILAEMQRVSRQGVAVVDLRGSRLLTWLVALLLRLLRVGPIAYHDGVVSARRGWSFERLRRLLGSTPAELSRRAPFRFALVLPGTAPRQTPCS